MDYSYNIANLIDNPIPMTKKRRSAADQSYRNKKRSQGGKGSALSMRANHKTDYKDDQGNTHPIKHSVAINEKLISNFSPTRRANVIKQLEKVVEEIPTHTPTYTPKKNAPSTPSSIKTTLIVDHSPSAERSTPKGTRVRKVGKIGEGAITIYTNEPPPKRIFKGKLFTPNDNKDVIKNEESIKLLDTIPPPTGPEKRIEAILNKKTVATAPKKSSRDQTKFFNKVSPNKHADALQESYEVHIEGVLVNKKIETLHVLAYRFIGEQGQQLDNLFLQTEEINTWMIPNEDFVEWLIKEFPDDDLKFVAAVPLKEKIINNEKKYTHFSEGIIKYRITSDKGLIVNLDLDVVNDGTPFHIQFAKYVNIFKVIILQQKEVNNSLKPPKP